MDAAYRRLTLARYWIFIQYKFMTRTAYKGRGAVSCDPGRFAQRQVDASAPAAADSAPSTVLKPMQARDIISTNQSPDIPFDRSINPYLGCEHGCIYCYARPGHSYLDLSPGLDFETQIFYKRNAAERLLAAWEKPGYDCKPITIGANTDPYQPAEKRLGITRELLQLFVKHRHPVCLISKGTLMRRDLDLLAELAALKLCSVAISVPTMNNELKRSLEPRVPAASTRFDLIRDLHDVDIPVSLLVAPIIPFVNDHEIESILERAAYAGAGDAGYIFLRLPHELKQLFRDWLATHLPERAEHVMSLVRQASGGRDYDNRFGRRQRGSGPYAEMIRQRFRRACGRYGLRHGGMDRRQGLDCQQFRPPGQQQLSLGL